jgi:aminobenzoyl-glutamate utilization protein B
LMHAQLERLGPPDFDEADHETARKFQETFSQEDILSTYKRFNVMPKKGQALCDSIFPPESGDGSIVGSTDVGTVSWVVPTVQMRGATYSDGLDSHRPACQSGSRGGRQGRP